MKDTRCRKWQITINNPIDKGFTHEKIKIRLSDMSNILYWCMSDEIGENGTYHTHLYICFSSARKFSTMKNKFEGAHFEMCKGTSQENRDYIFKEGKWEKDKKKETNLLETHEEYGDCPVEMQGRRTDLENLYDMIKQGMSNYEILENDPSYMLQLEKIDKVRQTLRNERFKMEFRNLEVNYIYGSTGVGKTRGVMELFGYENVFRVTDYLHPFDNYKGQDVIIFEEFRSSLKIQDMLNYLDGYPLELPSRYNNKVACFTKVYIITNLELLEQYESVQRNYNTTWKAFLRRINRVICMQREKSDIYNVESYLSRKNDFKHISDDVVIPFDRGYENYSFSDYV